MRQKISAANYLIGVLFAGTLAAQMFPGQQPSSPGLQEQLEEQYKLAKVTGGTVVQPGTVLVLQKVGILAVSPQTPTAPSVRYKDGTVQSSSPPVAAGTHSTHPQDSAVASKDTPSLAKGEKVYVSRIKVDVKDEAISFEIHECDTCNGASHPSSYWSTVTFLFAKGYLENASVPEVEDTIGQVLVADASSTYAPPPLPANVPDSAAAAAGNAGTTNEEIIKMAQVKLGDAVIIAKIKSSACAFDTSADALIRLKQVGVSDAVIQAMIAAGNQSPDPAPAAAPVTPATTAPCGAYVDCIQGGIAAFSAAQFDQSLANFQTATRLEPANPEGWDLLGNFYLAAGQYQDAATMWDKTLALGGSVCLGAWQVRSLSFVQNGGTFCFSSRQASFALPNQQTPVSGALADFSAVKSHRLTAGVSWSLNFKLDGREYKFYFVPIGVQCTSPFACGPGGYPQQHAVADYFAQTWGKLAPGSVAN